MARSKAKRVRKPPTQSKPCGWATHSAQADIGARIQLSIETVTARPDSYSIVIARPGKGETDRIEYLSLTDIDQFAANVAEAIKVGRYYGILPSEAE